LFKRETLRPKFEAISDFPDVCKDNSTVKVNGVSTESYNNRSFQEGEVLVRAE